MRTLRESCSVLFAIAALVLPGAEVVATTAAQVQERIDQDVLQGRPLVVHVVVALCDNLHQGIVPVPARLGNGQDPKNNLYWGAAFGVRTHLVRHAGYELISSQASPEAGVLERIVLHRTVERGGRKVDLFVVAEAWDGRGMEKAINRFMEIAAGRVKQTVEVERGETRFTLRAASEAALVAFVGHNGLMDFSLGTVAEADPEAPPRSAMVLACASQPYFGEAIEEAGAQPLLLTTGLMAPEAYTLEAAVAAFASRSEPDGVRRAAADAYNQYQKCGQRAALRLFVAGK